MKTLNQFLDESTGGGVPLTPQELEIQKKMSRLNVRLARKRSQQMQKAKVDDTETAPEQVKEGDVHSGQGEKIQKRTLEWMKKRGKKGAPGLDAMKARTAEHKAKRGEKRHPRDQKELDRAKAFIKKNPKFGVKEGKGYQPEIEHIKGSDLLKKKKKVDLPPHLRLDAMKKAFAHTNKVSEGEDRAFNFVRDKLKKKYGDGVLTTGEKPKPPTAKQKAEYAAHKAKLAKQDHRDPTEKASDGRYSDRHSNRGSD